MQRTLRSQARMGAPGDTPPTGATAAGRRSRSITIATLAAVFAAAAMLASAPLAGAAKLPNRSAPTRAASVTHATRSASRHQRALERAHRLAAAKARLRAAHSGRRPLYVSKAFAAQLERENSPINTPLSSQGTDFWLTFESNCNAGGCVEGPGNLYLFISGNTATTGTVTAPDSSFSQSFSVTPGVATVIQLPSPTEDDLSDQIAQDAVHVTAGSAVSVYGLNTYTATTDGFTGLPTNILGTSYLVEGYGGGGGSQFAIVGTQDGTTVTITPSENINSYTAGTPYQITLNQGDVYQLVDETGFGAGGDLSGTSITSSAPVAVFGGNDCADVPVNDVACNTLAEEMTPTDTWGTGFYTEPLATRSGDTFRFMASEDSTTVDVDGSPVATLNTGQFFETILTTASVITANNPIQVMQYSNGSSYDGANADPFDITIPPYAQYENSYTISTEPSGADPAIIANYLNVVAPTSEIGDINLDGSLVPSSDFTQIGTSDYSGAQLSVDFGSHTLSAPLPFGLTVYGFGGYDGYGYPGGFTLSPIAVVSSISLSVSPSSQTVGDQACATATVDDQNGNPVDGVNVEFTITGANPQVGFAYTDSSGQAQYCWTGTNTGLDTVVASVQTINSNTETVNWTSAPPSPTQISTSLTGGGQSGGSITVAPGTAVTDSSSLSGANAATATGGVTYSVYSDAACTQLVSGPDQESIATPGSLPDSQAVSLNSPGTYYWQAVYGGDSANAGSSSSCGSEVETVSQPSSPQPTSVDTQLTGGGSTNWSIIVPDGSSVTDQATLSGANVGSAGGTVTYQVYSDSICSVPAAPASTVGVVDGVVPASAVVSLPTGNYYWTVTYSGDAGNDPSADSCFEHEVVLSGARFGADVGVGLAIQPASPPVGSQFVICVTVANYGPKAAGHVFGGVLLPAGVTVVNPAGATQIGRLLYWKIGSMTVGETITYEVWVSDASPGSVKISDGALSLSTIDPNYHNNFASESVTVNGPRVSARRVSGSSGVLLARLRVIGRRIDARR